MVERLIEDEGGRKRLIAFIGGQSLPFVATIKGGKMRSLDQNRLQWLWANEASSQRGDISNVEVQREWKLNIGVPILLEENAVFPALWEAVDEKLTYEERLLLMHALQVTRIMTTKQLSRYLDEVYRQNTEAGIELTNPEDLKWGKP
jgi:hypothetical protein